MAIAAALEDESYPLDEFIYDLANLDTSFRFCGEEHRWAGRLATICQQPYGTQSIPGYLEAGMPPKYGAGAELVVASVHRNPLSKHEWVTELLGTGDIDRVIIEWRSLMRQIAHAPDLDWPRWMESFTESSAEMSEREFWAMAQMAPLSLAVATFRPVEIRFWLVASCPLVAFRLCRAIIAPRLVLTLFSDM